MLVLRVTCGNSKWWVSQIKKHFKIYTCSTQHTYGHTLMKLFKLLSLGMLALTMMHCNDNTFEPDTTSKTSSQSETSSDGTDPGDSTADSSPGKPDGSDPSSSDGSAVDGTSSDKQGESTDGKESSDQTSDSSEGTDSSTEGDPDSSTDGESTSSSSKKEVIYGDEIKIEVEGCEYPDNNDQFNMHADGYTEYFLEGDYLLCKDIDFGTGLDKIKVRYTSESNGAKLEVRIDAVDGDLIGEVDLRTTGSWNNFVTYGSDIELTTGVHDLYLVARHEIGVGNIDYVGLEYFKNDCDGQDLCDNDLNYPAYTPDGSEFTINRSEYLERLEGFWLAECIANWMGLQTEFDRKHAPFYTMQDWNQGENHWVFTTGDKPWGSDDDTDVEYTYQHLLDEHNKSILTGEQIRDGWLAHFWYEEPNYLWVSNQNAQDLMVHQNMIPPETSEPNVNNGYAAIDAQLTTEIFGLFSPARPDKALEMAHLPIRVSAKNEAEWIAEFYVIMHSLSAYVDKSLSMKEQVLWLAEQGRMRLPDDSYPAHMYDFVKGLYEKNQKDWEYARDQVYENYQLREGGGYKYGTYFKDWGDDWGAIDAGINFASSMVSLMYGEGDIQYTLKIGALTGWDSDNPTATWGGLLGSMLGKSGVVAAFADEEDDLSMTYRIHRTRQNFPDHTPDLEGEDSFYLMAQRGVYIIDRVIQEELGGGVDLENDLWYIPDNGGTF